MCLEMGPHRLTFTMWSLACLAVGTAVGFLFGVPRVVQSPVASSGNGYTQHVNTSLEQISDWLTKIIIGLGLVHFGAGVEMIKSAAAILAPGDGSVHRPFALGAIVYFVVIGVLQGYLFTRLFLQGAFFKADVASSAPVPISDKFTAAAPVTIDTNPTPRPEG